MKYYVADAFVDVPFTGNPAGVCVLDEWLPDSLLQAIATQNNLSETAFLVKNGVYEGGLWTRAPRAEAAENGGGAYAAHYGLRWFTPEMEIDLCGHATLASAFILNRFVEQEAAEVRFSTLSGGLSVARRGDLFEMDFPAKPMRRVAITQRMEKAVGEFALEAHIDRDLVLLLENEAAVARCEPNQTLVRELGYFALCVTAKGEGCDFVSRFFAPEAGIFEDPVTGSSHSELIPFWASRLGKAELTAKQLSRRGGTLYCRDCGRRVKIAGKARLYLEGEISV